MACNKGIVATDQSETCWIFVFAMPCGGKKTSGWRGNMWDLQISSELLKQLYAGEENGYGVWLQISARLHLSYTQMLSCTGGNEWSRSLHGDESGRWEAFQGYGLSCRTYCSVNEAKDSLPFTLPSCFFSFFSLLCSSFLFSSLFSFSFLASSLLASSLLPLFLFFSPLLFPLLLRSLMLSSLYFSRLHDIQLQLIISENNWFVFLYSLHKLNTCPKWKTFFFLYKSKGHWLSWCPGRVLFKFIKSVLV